MVVDLYRREQRKLAWLEGEDFFHAIAETNSDAIIVIDDESTMLFVSAAAEEIFGYAVAEMTGAPLTMLMPSYLRHVHEAALKRYGETGHKHTSWAGVELPGLHRSGREIPLEISFSEFIRDGTRFFTGIARDITERKHAVKKYRSIFENAVEGIFQSTPDGLFISVNPAMASMFGYGSPEELIAERIDIERQHYIEPERRAEFKRLLAERGIVQGFEYQARRKDGSKIWTSENVRAVRDAGGTLLYYEGFVEDITERKRVEQALYESEDRYRDLVEHSQELMCTHDLEGRIISVNPWAEKTLGYDLNDLLGKNIRDFLVTEFRDEFEKYMAAIRRHGFAKGLMQVQTATGEKRIWEYYNTLRTHGVAAPIVRGIAHDITERQQAEEALIQSERDYRRLFESAHDAIIILAPDGEIVLEVNQRACEIYGFNRSEFIGLSLETISHDIERGRLRIKETLEHGTFYNYETIQYRKDGTKMFLEINASVVEYKGRRAIQSINRDITERKQAEMERTQLLRRLVAAQEEERNRIARELHDQVGQYLAALMLGLKSVKAASQSEPSIQSGITKLQEMTIDFSQEVRRLALELRPPALDDLGLHTALLNYLEQWSERYGILVDLQSDSMLNQRFPPHIETTLYRVIQEALTNVLKHAQAQHVSLVLKYRGGQLLAIIEDDGCGFDADSALNVPVKERRLGLTGMRERAESAGGTLGIESSPGIGTTLVVRIPVSIQEDDDQSEHDS